MRYCAIITVFLTFLSRQVTSQEDWTLLESPTQIDLYKVAFLGSQTGWAAGDSGIIMKTTDGGSSWVIQESGTDYPIYDLQVLPNGEVWALVFRFPPDSVGTDLLRTTDSGMTWTQAHQFDQYYFAFHFTDSLNGVIGGLTGTIQWTSDAGITWNDALIDTFYQYQEVLHFAFYDNMLGFALGGDEILGGACWRTTDGGRSWSMHRTGSNPLRGLHFFDLDNIVGVGGKVDGWILSGSARSSDSGLSWEATSIGAWGIPTALAFRTQTEGWAPMAISTNYLVTRDSGLTWIEEPTPTGSPMIDVVFVDSVTGYMVGEEGVILKYDMTTTVTFEDNVPGRVLLHQNYPNPFNPSTSIRLSLPRPSEVSLTIFNLLGEEVATLGSGPRDAGTHTVQWDATGHPSGVYFYRLRAGEFVETKKLLLVR